MKQLEIERKFILFSTPILYALTSEQDNIERLRIHQFYILDDELSIPVRYRQTTRLDFYENETLSIKFEKFIKKNISHGINEEEFWEISKDDFLEAKKENIISELAKSRDVYHDKEQNLKFELDNFYPKTLLILEVELPDINHKFTFPEVIENQIIHEVTGISAFSNMNLGSLKYH